MWALYNYHCNDAYWEKALEAAAVLLGVVLRCSVLKATITGLALPNERRGSPWSSIQDRVPWASLTSPPGYGHQLLPCPAGTGCKLRRKHTRVTSCWAHLIISAEQVVGLNLFKINSLLINLSLKKLILYDKKHTSACPSFFRNMSVFSLYQNNNKTNKTKFHQKIAAEKARIPQALHNYQENICNMQKRWMAALKQPIKCLWEQ